MKMNKLAFAICTVLGGISISAQAQVAHVPDTDERIEKIIVYGEKQQRDIQDSPVSVAVLTEALLEESTIQSFNDVYNRMANVSTLRGGNETLFAIRGISVQGLSDNPNSYTAGVYVDDIALDNLAIRYGAMGVWDVQQIEVYRGPQATLQGRNALNGAVHIRTNDPEYAWGGKAQVYYGSNNSSRLSVAAGGPIITDELAFRIAVDKYKSDGFVDNITRGEDDYSGFDRQTIRGKLLWEPEALDQLAVRLTFNSVRNDMGDNPNIRLDAPFSKQALSDSDAYHNIEADMAALNVQWQFSDQLTFTSITTLGDDKYDRLDDFDSSVQPGSTILQTGDSDTFSQEFRFNFEYDSVSGIAGFYYGEVDRDADWDLATLYPKAGVQGQAFALMTAPAPFGLGLDLTTADAIWGYVPTFIQVQQLFDSNYDIKNKAIFGEATWQATDKWAFTLGARYDKEDQDRDQKTITRVLDTIAVDSSFPPLTIIASTAAQQLLTVLEGQLQGQSEDISTDYDAFLPKFVAQYSWSEQVDTAFSVQRGYRAGGSSVNFATSEIVEFDPEYTWNYEFSLRSMLMDGDLRLNANVFYTEWEDQQVDVSPSGDTLDKFIGNAGESELYGAEIEVTAFVNDHLDWFVNAGYVKTEYNTFTTLARGELQDFAGNEFLGAPNLTLGAGFNYSFDESWRLSMDASYQNQAYLDNANTREADARLLVNGKLAYKQDNWGAQLWVTNLFDRDYIVVEYLQQAGVPVQDYATPGDPRMIGVSVNYEF